MEWTPVDQFIIDIGGSHVDLDFGNLLPEAFRHKGPFPKEIAYTKGMEKWNAVSSQSYQTTDELEIIKATARDVVSQLPSGINIIDLGAANSSKYEAYAEEFFAQGKSCVYVPLDLSHDSLLEQIALAKSKFPDMSCIGLWGSFQDGDAFFDKIPDGKLFLSLGSIFYNAPDDMCKDRCGEFVRHLSPIDRLIVGQDGPSGDEGTKCHASYGTKEYDGFFSRYLEGIHDLAGISSNPKDVWSVQSKSDATMHFFEVTATETLVCTKLDGFVVDPGTSYTMFPSWKRGEAEIHHITRECGLAIKTLAKAKGSGMRQYMIQKP